MGLWFKQYKCFFLKRKKKLTIEVLSGDKYNLKNNFFDLLSNCKERDVVCGKTVKCYI